MTKRRFEVRETPKPTSPMFKKFGVGEIPNETSPTATEQLRSEGGNPTPAKPSPKGKKKDPDPTSKTDSKDTTHVQCQFPAGIPKAFENRVIELCARHGITPDYACKWLIPETKRRMSDINPSTLPTPLPDPKMAKPSLHTAFKLEAALLEKFRAVHDPLDVYTLTTCARHIYFAAFEDALKALAVRLGE